MPALLYQSSPHLFSLLLSSFQTLSSKQHMKKVFIIFIIFFKLFLIDFFIWSFGPLLLLPCSCSGWSCYIGSPIIPTKSAIFYRIFSQMLSLTPDPCSEVSWTGPQDLFWSLDIKAVWTFICRPTVISTIQNAKNILLRKSILFFFLSGHLCIHLFTIHVLHSS